MAHIKRARNRHHQEHRNHEETPTTQEEKRPIPQAPESAAELVPPAA